MLLSLERCHPKTHGWLRVWTWRPCLPCSAWLDAELLKATANILRCQLHRHCFCSWFHLNTHEPPPPPPDKRHPRRDTGAAWTSGHSHPEATVYPTPLYPETDTPKTSLTAAHSEDNTHPAHTVRACGFLLRTHSVALLNKKTIIDM